MASRLASALQVAQVAAAEAEAAKAEATAAVADGQVLCCFIPSVLFYNLLFSILIFLSHYWKSYETVLWQLARCYSQFLYFDICVSTLAMSSSVVTMLSFSFPISGSRRDIAPCCKRRRGCTTPT